MLRSESRVVQEDVGETQLMDGAKRGLDRHEDVAVQEPNGEEDERIRKRLRIQRQLEKVDRRYGKSFRSSARNLRTKETFANSLSIKTG